MPNHDIAGDFAEFFTPDAREFVIDMSRANRMPFAELVLRHARALSAVRALWVSRRRLQSRTAELGAQLASIEAADPDLFDPRGGSSRGAAYETYGSAGHELREKYLAAIGLVPEGGI